MKNLLTFLGILILSVITFTSNAQIIVSQSFSPTTNLKVGDTLTIKYTIDRGTTTPRYFWLRYSYNNKSLAMVTNSTTFSQGTSTQTFFTSWDNYKFTPASNIADTQLYTQYQTTPWGYTANNDWNVGQLTIQRTDASINGDIATQKFVIKDQNTYNDIHKLDLSYAINASSVNISPITRSATNLSLIGVTGNTSQFKVKVLFPSGYTITDHKVQLMHLKPDGSIDFTKQPITQKTLDASGEALFTTEVKVGDSFGVYVQPVGLKTWMNNIITVSDAYKAFLGHSQTNIGGTPTYFTYPTLEKNIGKVTISNTTFGEGDSYALFAHVMGIDVSTIAKIPKSTSTDSNVLWYSGLLNQSWLDGTIKNKVTITTPIQEVYAVFAWGGDLNWSHSSDPATITARITAGQYTNASTITGGIQTITKSINTNSISNISMSYQTTYETAKLSVVSTLENGKVVLTTNLSKEELAGLQVIMNYDNSKIELDNIIFDSGSTITNFSTKEGSRLTFGSIDQTKIARIKTGTPYKLIFTPKVTLTNTAGLFFFVLSDAVDAKGNKIDLIIE